MKTSLFLAAGLIASGIVGTASTAGADAIAPIGPDQYFRGLVNGVHENAVIKVVCPGPIVPGQTGAPVSGQTVQVTQGSASTPGGYTGSAANSIVVTFPANSSTDVLSLTAYNDPKEIPTALRFPCSGTGVVYFNPSPGSSTARPDRVTVTYVNIAV